MDLGESYVRDAMEVVKKLVVGVMEADMQSVLLAMEEALWNVEYVRVVEG